MVDREKLLSDLQSVLRTLEADLLDRSDSDEVPEVREWLRAEYTKGKNAERTAQTQQQWTDDFITQVAAAWVLSCVFVRFLEDNGLVDPPHIAGPGKRLERARDEHTLFFQDPTRAKLTDREYFLDIFRSLAKVPAVGDVFEKHNPLNTLPNWLGPDAAGELLRFFQKIDANSGSLIHDFTDPDWDTRFLGDLYQDLSETARKKYALLQTPEFVEEFILDRTLEPALDEFGLTPPLPRGGEGRGEGAASGPSTLNSGLFKMIDPACGSGHFLLGSFPRILRRWQKEEPGTNIRVLVQRTLDSIHGVDINAFAIAIARFRLLLAALRACGLTRLVDAPPFELNLACGDSLYHGVERQQTLGDWTDESHYFRTEDADNLTRILQEGTFHAVVANPPYITPKDKAANKAYRRLYDSCHRKYSLAVPFMERIFRLAKNSETAGFTGQITANSFMKREFGKKLIESFFPTMDLTHVIDTSGAYIPGHGTPTVILFGRNRKPLRDTIRTAMGIRGEPSTPNDPSLGLVWSAIVEQLDQPNSQSDFVSVGDASREPFHKHPWSIGGGGAAELKEQLEDGTVERLGAISEEIGFFAITGEDDAYVADPQSLRRTNLSGQFLRQFTVGDMIRDWEIATNLTAIFPYQADNVPSLAFELMRHFWPVRTLVSQTLYFGKVKSERGMVPHEYVILLRNKLRTPLSITYGEVATHNHFVLDRGGKVFNRTAPVIKLPTELTTPDGGTRVVTEDDHLTLLGLLNSSTACFWMKQVCHQKQMMGGDGIRIESKTKVPYAFSGTALGRMPIPDGWKDGPLRERLLRVTREMDAASQKHSSLTAKAVLASGASNAKEIRTRWQEVVEERRKLRALQVFLQEQIDFVVYRMFDLISDDLVGAHVRFDGFPLTEGDRPFCIINAVNEDGFSVPAGVPADWPEDLRTLWQSRMDAINESKELRLIETATYKRRWIGRQGLFNHQRMKDEFGGAAKEWLLDRLESYYDFDGRLNEEGKATAQIDIGLVSVAKLAEIARQDEQFMEVAEVYRDDPAFDVQKLVEELVKGEHVPLLPVLRYKPKGLRNRGEWEKTWELQRLEDKLRAGEDVRLGDYELADQQRDDIAQWQQGTPENQRADDRALDAILSIPVPPKYKSSDFISTGGARYWALRGKLDVPKERWISFPNCEGEDGTLMICWAGYDHLQQASAIAAHFVRVKEEIGGADDQRLVPLLACLIELLPWLKQWHNEPNAEFDGLRMGDYYEGFINEEARNLPRTTTNADGEEVTTSGWTIKEIKAWQPPQRTGGRRRRRSTT